MLASDTETPGAETAKGAKGLMMKKDDTDAWLGLMSLVFVGLLLLSGTGWRWYRAGAQAGIYRRQGIEMTQWECFMGLSPAEKVIQIKEEKTK
jgi:hypothetical protein